MHLLFTVNFEGGVLAKGEHPYCNSTLKLILSKTTISQSTPLSTSTTNTLNPLVGNLPNRTPRRVMKVPLAVGVLYTLAQELPWIELMQSI